MSLAFAGAITADTMKLYLLGLPCMLAGTWVGLKLYGKIDDAQFRKTVLRRCCWCSESSLIVPADGVSLTDDLATALALPTEVNLLHVKNVSFKRLERVRTQTGVHFAGRASTHRGTKYPWGLRRSPRLPKTCEPTLASPSTASSGLIGGAIHSATNPSHLIPSHLSDLWSLIGTPAAPQIVDRAGATWHDAAPWQCCRPPFGKTPTEGRPIGPPPRFDPARAIVVACKAGHETSLHGYRQSARTGPLMPACWRAATRPGPRPYFRRRLTKRRSSALASTRPSVCGDAAPAENRPRGLPVADPAVCRRAGPHPCSSILTEVSEGRRELGAILFDIEGVG